MRSEADIRARLAEVEHLLDRFIVENSGEAATRPDLYEIELARYRAAIWTLGWVLGDQP